MEEREELVSRIRELESRLAEAEASLSALRSGEVDASVGSVAAANRAYTRKGADEPYRLLVQEMAEGAITVTSDGLILFSNQQFADTVASPLERVIGCRIFEFLDPECLETARALIDCAHREKVKGELRLRRTDGRMVPAYFSVNRLRVEGLNGFCLVVTDLTEQKRSEEIVLAEKLARSILEQAAEAILVLDLDGRIVRASRAADRLAGVNVLLRDFSEVFQVRNAGGLPLDFRSILAMAERGTGDEPVEMPARNWKGDPLCVLLSVAPLSGQHDRVMGCIVHLTDVTQRKAIEESLMRSEQKYHSLADAMPQIVQVSGPDGGCEYVNRQWEVFTGNSSGAGALNLDWLLQVHPEDRPGAAARWSQGVKSGADFEIEFRLLRHDGQYRWHLARAKPIFDEGGALAKWISAATDIQQFKEAEAKLRESEERFRTMAEAIPEILFTARPDGACTYASARAYEFSGLAEGVLLGSGWLDPIHPEDRETVRHSWMRCAAAGVPFNVEYRLRRADGAYHWMQVRAEPMTNGSGEIVRWFGVCSDIDNHKRQEESLRRQALELARSNEELQRFPFAASHDLQEPLRTVGSISQLLVTKLSGKLDAEEQELIGHIDGGVRRMSSLIRGLLDYSRVSADGAAKPKPVDCNALLTFALMNVRGQVAETGASITHDPLPVVLADDQVVRVFQNLLGNALKYRGEKPPQIHVSSKRNRGEWIISVRDNGIGLDMRYADRIFGLFQRLHARDEYDGIGVGLTICRRIVERHGGRIWVESTPGVGSTFSFALRAAAQ